MDLVCPFSATLVKNDFDCCHADHVVRRGGAEIACQSVDNHVECCAIHRQIKTNALEALGLEDDLLSLPHSVLVKIQYGGLLGLQAVMGKDAAVVGDIASLVMSVRQTYANYAELPYATINSAIADYRQPRRGRK